MSDAARSNIFARLKNACAGLPEAARPAKAAPAAAPDVDLRDLFQERMEAVCTEIHRVKKNDWLAALAKMMLWYSSTP